MRPLTAEELGFVSGGEIVIVTASRPWGGMAGAMYAPLPTFNLTPVEAQQIGLWEDFSEWSGSIELQIGQATVGVDPNNISVTTEGDRVTNVWRQGDWTYVAIDVRSNGVGFDALARSNGSRIEVFRPSVNGLTANWFRNN